MKKIIVVGGGAAGLMAAYAAASTGKQVILLEKNEKLGKKIYITGKGRCNLTNDCSPDDFLNNLVRGAKFMTRTAYVFPPSKTMEFFESNGLPLKVERGNRVFPVSDHASDVTKTLERACRNAGVQICLGTCVTGLKVNDGAVCGVLTDDGERPCDAVIIATGGLSYPSTGSTGDGYRFALAAGHTVVPTVRRLWESSLRKMSRRHREFRSKMPYSAQNARENTSFPRWENCFLRITESAGRSFSRSRR